MAYMSSRYYLAAFLSFSFMVSILLLPVEPLEATNKSPYDSGYDHGCDYATYPIQTTGISTNQKEALAFTLTNL